MNPFRRILVLTPSSEIRTIPDKFECIEHIVREAKKNELQANDVNREESFSLGISPKTLFQALKERKTRGYV
jgi:hypothetical protein